MATSKTPDLLAAQPPEQLREPLAALFERLKGTPESRLFVAFSGGRDSTALLHAACTLDARRVVAVHVDHGLQSESTAWATHCKQIAAQLGAEFRCVRLAQPPQRGDSIEAWARDARYQALGELLKPADLCATAHHQADQAETVLLRLLRGSGVTGLAAVQPERALGAARLVRPWIHVPAQDVDDYARSIGLSWIDDGSNQDQRFDRNWLRATVMPLLRQRWPQAARTLARHAHLARETASLLDEIAQQDATACADTWADLATDADSTVHAASCGLRVSRLLALSTARRNHVFRYWLSALRLPMPSAAVLARMTTEVCQAGEQANPVLRWPGAEMRRYRGVVYACAPLAAPPAAQALGTHTREISWFGTWRRPADCADSGWSVRAARPGDTITEVTPAGATRPKKAVNRWGQERGIPPWLRSRMPLLLHRDTICAVGGLGVRADRLPEPPVWISTLPAAQTAGARRPATHAQAPLAY